MKRMNNQGKMMGRDELRRVIKETYRSHYKYTATLISAIRMKGHFELITMDDQQRTLLKIYADKDLSEEVAVFTPHLHPDRIRTDKSWVLLRQNKPKITVSYENEDGEQN
jgi:hypothetical protein